MKLAPERGQIKKEVCRFYGIEEGALLNSQRGKSNEPRNVVIYLCRALRNDTLLDIGQAFGLTGYSPAGSAIERVKRKLLEDDNFQNQIMQIKNGLFGIKVKWRLDPMPLLVSHCIRYD